MKQGIMTSIDWSFIGAELAQADDKDQIAFFNAMAKEMNTYGTHFQTETQQLAITKGLNDEAKEMVGALAEFSRGDDNV